jgi:hypothetical protein
MEDARIESDIDEITKNVDGIGKAGFLPIFKLRINR